MKKLYFTLGILTGVLLFYSFFRGLNQDEIEAIHTTWKVVFEGKIYTDFFQPHHPFLYYLLAPILKIFGPTTNIIYIFRFIIFLFFLGIGYATYLLAKTLVNKRVGVLSAIMLYSTPIFSISAIEIRPDVPMTFCIIFAAALWFPYLQQKRKSLLAASAFMLSISFLFLQKAALFIFVFGLLVLLHWITKKTTFTDLVLYAAVFFLAPSIYLFYLLYSHTFSDYFLFAWLFNFNLTCKYSFIQEVFFAIRSNIPLWITFLTGLALIRKHIVLQQIAFLGIALFLAPFFIKTAGPQYIMPAIPFTSIIAAYGFSHVMQHYQKAWKLLLVLIVFPPLIVNYLRKPFVFPVAKQIEKINYVLSITNADDRVFSCHPAWNLFRKDCDFFWYHAPLMVQTCKRIKPYSYDFSKIIEIQEPKVISVPGVNMYRRSPIYKDLYIRKDGEQV